MYKATIMCPLLCVFWVPTAFVSFFTSFCNSSWICLFSIIFFWKQQQQNPPSFRFTYWKNVLTKQIAAPAQAEPTYPVLALIQGTAPVCTVVQRSSATAALLHRVWSLPLPPCQAEGIDTFGSGTRKAWRITWGSYLNACSVASQVSGSDNCRGKGTPWPANPSWPHTLPRLAATQYLPTNSAVDSLGDISAPVNSVWTLGPKGRTDMTLGRKRG